MIVSDFISFYNRCVKTGLGEPGLLLGRISQSAKFQGYRGNRPETEKKILKDVFKVVLESLDFLFT